MQEAEIWLEYDVDEKNFNIFSFETQAEGK